MTLTGIAVLIVGVWMILTSQEPVSTTLTLVLGIVVAVLAILDSTFVRGRWGARNS